jgi:DSF synthase
MQPLQELNMNSIIDFNQLAPTTDQVDTRFEPEFGVLWYLMRPKPRPCFNKTCLQSLLQRQTALLNTQGQIEYQGALHQVNYLVLASHEDGVFNLGGDLSTFKQLILAKDRAKLGEYAALCIDNLWTFYDMPAPVRTVSLVQGQAMGGGFEAALSAHVMIAERSALMGLPEVLFNLFPGMGALSFLSRKVGMRVAEQMVRSGKIYTGEELFEMGVVDVLAEDGEGEWALTQWVKKDYRSLNAYQAINKAKQSINPLTYQELHHVTEIWVEAALRLDERNLKVMERLVRAQNAKVISTSKTGVVQKTA